jgi:Putative peptidoglycan binding domain
MKTKRLVFMSCFAAAALMASPALSALPQKHTATRSSHTTVRTSRMGTTATVRSSPTTVRSGRMGTTARVRSSPMTVRSRMGTTFVNRTFPNNQVVSFDTFGSPFFYPYYGSYPYYNYGYYPYSYYGGYPYNYSYSYYAPGYGYGASTVAAVQQRLGQLGYYHGAVDGVMGPRTRGAIAAYESTHGMAVDGTISRPLLHSLGVA